MATAESTIELRKLLRVEFAPSADRDSWPLDLTQTTAALDILRDFMDSCYVVMNPASIMASVFTGRNRGGTGGVTNWDERYLEARERLREPEDAYRLLVKAQLILQGRRFWPFRLHGPPLTLVSIRRGS